MNDMKNFIDLLKAIGIMGLIVFTIVVATVIGTFIVPIFIGSIIVYAIFIIIQENNSG